MSTTTALIRNEPVQARSTLRLTSLLDAAAKTIDEVGFERLTTAMVADRAGASIGTVYRYFPDRISVLQAVAARSTSKFVERARKTLFETQHETWWDAIDQLIDEGVKAFQTEPGFASLRFGDMLDLRPRENSRTGSSYVSAVISSYLAKQFGFADDNELSYHLEVGFNLLDSLLHRAFMFDRSGDPRFIADAKVIVKNYLESVLGPVKA